MKELKILIAALVLFLIGIVVIVILNLACPNWPPSHKEMSQVVTYTDLDIETRYIAF